MTVKDLVQQFESFEPQPSATRPFSHGRSELGKGSRSNQNAGDIHEEPLPRNARFIKYRAVPTSSPPPPLSSSRRSPSTSETIPSASSTHSQASSPISTTSRLVDSETTTIKASGSQSSALIPYTTKSSFATHLSPQDSLANSSAVLDSHEEPVYVKEHTYPPDTWPRSDTDSSHHLNTRHRPSRYRRRSHKPVPAPIVFSRRAYPLSLPKLDDYIASLPPPFLGDERKDSHGGMFPPMDTLAKTGRSIEDLETNSVVAPAWKNRVSIVGGSISALIGLLVSGAVTFCAVPYL